MSKEDLLSFKEYEKIFKQSKKCGARSILWLGYGEPLFFNRFWDFIDLINECGFILVFFTNGSRITKDIAKELHDMDFSIYIKLIALILQSKINLQVI